MIHRLEAYATIHRLEAYATIHRLEAYATISIQFHNHGAVIVRPKAQPLLANGQNAGVALLDHTEVNSNPQTDFRQAVRAVAGATHIHHAGIFAFREGVEWELKSRDHGSPFGSPLSHLRFSLNTGMIAVG